MNRTKWLKCLFHTQGKKHLLCVYFFSLLLRLFLNCRCLLVSVPRLLPSLHFHLYLNTLHRRLHQGIPHPKGRINSHLLSPLLSTIEKYKTNPFRPQRSLTKYSQQKKKVLTDLARSFGSVDGRWTLTLWLLKGESACKCRPAACPSVHSSAFFPSFNGGGFGIVSQMRKNKRRKKRGRRTNPSFRLGDDDAGPDQTNQQQHPTGPRLDSGSMVVVAYWVSPTFFFCNTQTEEEEEEKG